MPIVQDLKYFEHGLSNILSTLDMESHPPDFEHGLTELR